MACGDLFPVTTAYRFGEFELQPKLRRLPEAGRPAALGPRAVCDLVRRHRCDHGRAGRDWQDAIGASGAYEL